MPRGTGARRRLLIITQSTPFPARRSGIAMRYAPIIERLKASYDLDIFDLSQPSSRDDEYVEGVRQLVVPAVGEGRSGRLRYLLGKLSVLWRFLSPLDLPLYYIDRDDGRLARVIRGLARDRDYEAIVWVGPGCCGLFTLTDLRGCCRRLVYDLIDSPYLLASRDRLDFFRFRWFKTYELWKTRRMERKARRMADRVVYISRKDAMSTGPEETDGVTIIPNGIYLDDYVETRVTVAGGRTIGFFGDLRYGPNKAAVDLLAGRILPGLRARDAEVRLYVIGKKDASLEGLAGVEGVTVTGFVENIWHYVNAMDLLVFPILSGAGLKNKVLEAMYAGKAVVTTTIGNEGIDARDGEEIVICDDIDAYPAVIDRLLSDAALRERIGGNAKRFVQAHFSWETIFDAYEDVFR